MSDWVRLNKHRVSKAQDSHYGSDLSYGFTGFFCLMINGLPIKCIACDLGGWEHVSVSIQGSTSVPSWSVMCQVKDLFWEDEDCVVQYHPPKSEYVNTHPGVLHLWHPIDAKLPTPPQVFV